MAQRPNRSAKNRAQARARHRRAPQARRVSVRRAQQSRKEARRYRFISIAVLVVLVLLIGWWVGFNGVGKVGGLIDTDGDGQVADADDKANFIQDNAAAFSSGSSSDGKGLPYHDLIASASKDYGVDPYLIAGVIQTESNWDPNASSGVGAQGLMQVTPIAAQEMVNQGLVDSNVYSPDNLYDPETNIRYGTALLSWSLNLYGGSEDVALAAYNGGSGNAQRWVSEAGGNNIRSVIDLPETAEYLDKVENSAAQIQADYPNAF